VANDAPLVAVEQGSKDDGDPNNCNDILLASFLGSNRLHLDAKPDPNIVFALSRIRKREKNAKKDTGMTQTMTRTSHCLALFF
jgi:hypothetical protein